MTTGRALRIVTDSSADLPAEVVRELDITVVPLIVTIGESTYEDTALSQDAFWRLVAESEAPPRTSQPSPGSLAQAFERLVTAGYDVLCLTITGVHSGTFGVAWSVAQAYPGRVTVFDSQSLSLGLGLQVLRAAQWAREGLGLDEILARLRSLRERIHIIIQLDTVEFIRRGGRAAKLMPLIDRLVRALDLKPLLGIVGGELKLLGVARSPRKAMRRILDEIAQLGPLDFVAAMHIRCPQRAEELGNELARLTGVPRESIWVGEAGAVLAVHGGAGTLAAMGVTVEG